MPSSPIINQKTKNMETTTQKVKKETIGLTPSQKNKLVNGKKEKH